MNLFKSGYEKLQKLFEIKPSELGLVVDVTPKMYLILREDLSFKYIQGAHALTRFALNYSFEFKKWHNGYLICLSVFNGLALNKLVDDILLPNNVKFVEFWEPDLQSYLSTAVCLFDDGINGYRDLIKHLPLASK